MSKLKFEIDLSAAWKDDSGFGDCSSIADIIRDEIEKYVRKEVMRVIKEGNLLGPTINRLREKAVRALLADKEGSVGGNFR